MKSLTKKEIRLYLSMMLLTIILLIFFILKAITVVMMLGLFITVIPIILIWVEICDLNERMRKWLKI